MLELFGSSSVDALEEKLPSSIFALALDDDFEDEDVDDEDDELDEDDGGDVDVDDDRDGDGYVSACGVAALAE